MSFSPRQLHCLEAMGLVAWTSTNFTATELAADAIVPASRIPEPVVAEARDAEPDVNKMGSTAGLTTVPLSLPELAQWIVKQPLAGFKYRGSSINFIGSESASLLVICLTDRPPEDESAQLLMTDECTQMFELMMRAISMSRGAVRQCSVAKHAGSSQQSIDHVSTLCTVQTRAVLVLDPAVGADDTDASADSCSIPTSSLPLFRIPHPEQMIETPALKRRAWETLKKLQNVLLG